MRHKSVKWTQKLLINQKFEVWWIIVYCLVLSVEHEIKRCVSPRDYKPEGHIVEEFRMLENMHKISGKYIPTYLSSIKD